MSSNLKFAWDTTHLRDDLGDNSVSSMIWGDLQSQQYGISNQTNGQIFVQQPYSQQQVQYVPIPAQQPQYIPQPQQTPIVLNNSGNNKNGGTNSILRFIEFLLILGMTCAFVYFLITQSPETVEGLSSMINSAFDKLAYTLESVTP